MMDSLGQLRVTYTSTLADLFRFNLYLLPRARGIYIIGAIFILGISYSTVPTLYRSDAIFVVKVVTYLVILLLTSSVVALISLMAFLASYVPRLNKGILTEHTITLSADGFTETTLVNKTESTWAGLVRLGQTRGYIFLFISASAAHVIPKRAFASCEDAVEFYDYAKERFQLHNAA
jgi:hypothetical protein